MAGSNDRPGGMPHPADTLLAIDARTAEILRRMDRLEHALGQPGAAAAPSGSRYAVSRTRDGHFVTDLSDAMIGEQLRTQGHFEEDHIDRVLQLLTTVGIAVSKTLFLDIGANIGTHSLHALTIGFASALCVEPDPDNFRLLRINQILNGVDHRCHDVLAAASDRDDEGTLERSPTNFGDFRVRRREGAVQRHDESQWATGSVHLRTLDGILKEAEVSADDIGLAWVDTQGHEGFVFAGGATLLTARAPVVCEFWPYGLERSGAYASLRLALAQSKRKIYDLRTSIQSNRLVQINLEQLDMAYRAMLAGETETSSPHTDLLLI